MRRFRASALSRGLAVVLVGAALVVAMALAPQAQAYTVEPVVEQNLDTITEHVARGGATSVPGVDCGATCADWWLQEHRPIPGQPSSEELWRELRNVRVAGRVLPAMRFLGTVGLAAGAFDLGWKIGTGINAKLLKIGVPAAGAQGASYCTSPSPCTQLLTYKASPVSPSPDWAGPAYPDSEGGVFAWQWHGCNVFSCWTYSTRQVPDGGGAACDGDPSIPSALHVITATSAGSRCSATPVATQAGYLLPSEWRASAPVDDYTGQPSDVQTASWPDAPTTQDQLKTRIRVGFDNGDYPSAEAWYAHRLEPQTYDDPTEDEEQLRDCRPDDQQALGDPAPERGTQDYLQDPDRWRARYDTVPESAFLPGSAVPEDGLPATGGRAYMRWGWASLDAEKPEIDWEGWGYRKIVAKHGWGPTALVRTQEALLATPLDNGKYDEYISPDTYAGQSGKNCEWVVIVQRDPNETPTNPELSQQAPMGGIITAHGRWVR